MPIPGTSAPLPWEPGGIFNPNPVVADTPATGPAYGPPVAVTTSSGDPNERYWASTIAAAQQWLTQAGRNDLRVVGSPTYDAKGVATVYLQAPNGKSDLIKFDQYGGVTQEPKTTPPKDAKAATPKTVKPWADADGNLWEVGSDGRATAVTDSSGTQIRGASKNTAHGNGAHAGKPFADSSGGLWELDQNGNARSLTDDRGNQIQGPQKGYVNREIVRTVNGNLVAVGPDGKSAQVLYTAPSNNSRQEAAQITSDGRVNAAQIGADARVKTAEISSNARIEGNKISALSRDEAEAITRSTQLSTTTRQIPLVTPDPNNPGLYQVEWRDNPNYANPVVSGLRNESDATTAIQQRLADGSLQPDEASQLLDNIRTSLRASALGMTPEQMFQRQQEQATFGQGVLDKMQTQGNTMGGDLLTAAVKGNVRGLGGVNFTPYANAQAMGGGAQAIQMALGLLRQIQPINNRMGALDAISKYAGAKALVAAAQKSSGQGSDTTQGGNVDLSSTPGGVSGYGTPRGYQGAQNPNVFGSGGGNVPARPQPSAQSDINEGTNRQGYTSNPLTDAAYRARQF